MLNRLGYFYYLAIGSFDFIGVIGSLSMLELSFFIFSIHNMSSLKCLIKEDFT